MTKLLLDIGSGGSSFVRHFKMLNPHIEIMYLCGEHLSLHKWSGRIRPGAIQEINASYAKFNLPSNSLDMVTLNAPHPFRPPLAIEEELVRCLKKGGLFFSAHPIGVHPTLSEHQFIQFHEYDEQVGVDYVFQEESSAWLRWIFGIHWIVSFPLPRMGITRYPASPTIENRLEWKPFLEKFPHAGNQTGYVYRHTNAMPTVRVWMKK